MPSGKFLLLRAKPFRENDLIIDALSKSGEKFTFSALNALKSKKRFAGGVLEPLNYVEILYSQSQAGHLVIQEGKILYGFPKLRESYAKLQMAFHLLKMIQKVSHEGLGDNHEIFDLLGNSLRELETSDEPHLLKLQFELKYLFYLGFLAPDKDTKEFIGKTISQHQSIELTEEEYQYLSQVTLQKLKQIDLA